MAEATTIEKQVKSILARREDTIIELKKVNECLNEYWDKVLQQVKEGLSFIPNPMTGAFRAAIRTGDIAALHVAYWNRKNPGKSVVNVKTYSRGVLPSCTLQEYPVSQIVEFIEDTMDKLDYYKEQDELRNKYLAMKQRNVAKKTNKGAKTRNVKKS